MTSATKALAEMTMGELVQADLANSEVLEAASRKINANPISWVDHRLCFARRREIRAEIDRRKAEDRQFNHNL